MRREYVQLYGRPLFAAEEMFLQENPLSLRSNFRVRVREFRARGSEPVICDLDLPFWHLNFDILPSASNL